MTPAPVDATCPVCTAERPESHQLGKWRLHRCRRCGHRHVPLPPDNTPDLGQLYQSHYSGFDSDPVFSAAVRREIRENFRPRIPPPATILDVGCGNGEFLLAASESGYGVVGIDASSAAAELTRKRGLEAHAGDFLSYDFSRRFDFVTMWDVIEHLPDPRAFVHRALELLEPNGYLVVKTPYNSDVSVLLARMLPRLSGPVLQVPAHIQFFDSASMSELLRLEGFARVEWLEPRPMRGRGKPSGLRKAIARAVVSTIYRIGRDRNLYVMARKSAA